MAEYYTQTNGRRPDLEREPFAMPEGYIGQKLLPVYTVTDKTGTVYYAGSSAVVADSAAQTGRSVGAAPTAQNLANTSTTFTCAEIVDRASIPPDEVKSMGGIEKADKLGASVAKRNVMNGIEDAVVAITLGSGVTPSATFDADKFLLQVQTAADAAERYEGKSVLYGSTKVFKGIVRSLLSTASTATIFSRLVNGSMNNFQAWMNALAIFVGVDEILTGKTARWNPSAYAGRFGFMMVEEGNDPLAHKYQLVRGKTFLYLPDGNQPFEVRSYADEKNLINDYTALAWYNVVSFNSGSQYVWEGVTVE